MIYNQSHCADTTAAEAIYNAAIDERTKKAILCIKKFLKKNGYSLNKRIEITHVASGRVYK